MKPKIILSFVALITWIILFLLPTTGAMYDFMTDVRTDSLTAPTAVGVTSANVTLGTTVYDGDTTTISVLSSLSTDVPLFSSYDATTHSANFTGLTANTTRTLTVSYDVDALAGDSTIATLASKLNAIFLIFVILYGPAALAAIWTGRG